MKILNEKVVPFLDVSDAESSAEFYCSKIGFKKEWVFQRAPDAPKCICVSLGPAKLYLTEFQESAKGIKLFVWMDDLSSIIKKVKETGVEANIIDDEAHTHFGTMEVRIDDPDAHYIIFSTYPSTNEN